MTVVVDSSVVLAALVDQGADGSWAKRQLAGERMFAPQHMPAEVTNVLRRSSLAGEISPAAASLAHVDLLQLPVNLLGYRGFGPRVWELRENLTAYDAWYVAIAERIGAPLLTLDRRLANAPGPLCEFVTPPSADTFETGME